MDWRSLDRWMMGEALTGSQVRKHVTELCDVIGPRWSSSDAEQAAMAYIREQMGTAGLDAVALEEYELDTWAWTRAEARVVEDGRKIDILPFNRCPAFQIEGRIVDVGYGTPREMGAVQDLLRGSVAVMYLAFEPFTTPVHHAQRLKALAEAGAVAAFVIEKKDGRRVEYHSASDWRDAGLQEHLLPAVTTSREHGALLRRLSGKGWTLRAEVESTFQKAPSANVACELTGTRWPEEHLVLGGHHDTVFGAPGGNDNASGTIAVMETARVLAQLRAETGCGPGRTIRFVTYSAEEQKLQGSSVYVARHYGPETPPRLAINLDELSAGPIKGIVLGFPHLRELVQGQLDTMNDGLACHVMAQIDPSSDHFPFLRQGIDAAFLWRWRF
ncbi:MAG: M28 family peptidase, partial [bacterium]|nr:M28 family peptidase [bacterium]